MVRTWRQRRQLDVDRIFPSPDSPYRSVSAGRAELAVDFDRTDHTEVTNRDVGQFWVVDGLYEQIELALTTSEALRDQASARCSP